MKFEQVSMETLKEDNQEYEAFVDKFKPKLTTDDCYTPENIYQAVEKWVRRHYGLDETVRTVRPFWPGGDYKAEDYSGNCVVIDNPPFSIIAEIERWYLKQNIRFFLFAPSLTIFKPYNGLSYVIVDGGITYENGAEVATSFVTNLGNALLEVEPELTNIIQKENKKNLKKSKRELPVYEYPDEVLVAARMQKLAGRGVYFRAEKGEGVFIRKLDAMQEMGKSIFGGAFLLSRKAAAEKAAAEKAAAEKANAIIWKLSPRERELTEQIGEGKVGTPSAPKSTY